MWFPRTQAIHLAWEETGGPGPGDPDIPSWPLSRSPPKRCMTLMALSRPSLVCILPVRGSGGGRYPYLLSQSWRRGGAEGMTQGQLISSDALQTFCLRWSKAHCVESETGLIYGALTNRNRSGCWGSSEKSLVTGWWIKMLTSGNTNRGRIVLITVDCSLIVRRPLLHRLSHELFEGPGWAA